MQCRQQDPDRVSESKGAQTGGAARVAPRRSPLRNSTPRPRTGPPWSPWHGWPHYRDGAIGFSTAWQTCSLPVSVCASRALAGVRRRHGGFEQAVHEEHPQDTEREVITQIQRPRAFPGQRHASHGTDRAQEDLNAPSAATRGFVLFRGERSLRPYLPPLSDLHIVVNPRIRSGDDRNSRSGLITLTPGPDLSAQ